MAPPLAKVGFSNLPMSRRWLTILLVVLSVALIAAVGIWIFRDDDSSSSTAAGPEAVTVSELSGFAAEQGMPVYWLGERGDETYELTDSSSGRVYIRYLPEGTDAGDQRANFVTVATYPSEDGVAELRKAARDEAGAKLGKTDDGAVLLIDPASPNNAHLAYRGANLQVEIYSPVPGEALRLAARGAVRPVP
jgi:hypothetical protein